MKLVASSDVGAPVAAGFDTPTKNTLTWLEESRLKCSTDGIRGGREFSVWQAQAPGHGGTGFGARQKARKG